jgi:tetratricopeptide (TPR) repeat protein
MRLPAAILATLALASTAHPPVTSRHTPKTAAEITADSLYDAGATDSLLAFSQRMIERAGARRDSVLLGRMIYCRGRARLALRDARAPADFDHALEIAIALGDSAGRMQALGLQAFVAVNQGRFDESIRLNRERMALARALGRRGSEAWGHLLIGYAQLTRDSLPPAQVEYEQAWRGFAAAQRPREQLSASIGLGNVLARMGRYHGARTSYERAWLTARELGDRVQESDAINNIGVLEQEHGQLSLAAKYFDRAYEIKRELRTFDISPAARNVAAIDQMLGRYAHAESTLAEAMSLSGGTMLDAGLGIDVGRIRLAQGRNAAAARAIREAMVDRDQIPSRTRTDGATYLASALLNEDSAAAAVAVIDREVARIANHDGSSWKTTAYLMSARCRRAAGDAAGARESAFSAWQDASARADSILMVPAASLMSLCERDAGRDAEAFTWLERGRAAFESSRTEGDFQWREARRTELAAGLLESCDLLREYPPGVPAETRERALFDFLQQVQSRTLLERVTDPRRFDDAEPALARAPTSHVLQENVLRPGECFLLTGVAPGRVYVFTLTRDTFRATTIDDKGGALERRVLNYARLCAHAPGRGEADTAEAAARALGELLFSVSADALRSSPRIYAALDGFLAGFPLETVVCPGESSALGVLHETVRVPSAAFLAYLRARPDAAPPSPSVLAVASDARMLEGARAEVSHLVARYGATRAISPERNEFLASLSGYDVVHIASHVHVDGERPWNSGILIGAGDAAGAAASHAHDSTRAEPLVLSSAESNRVQRSLPRDPLVRASEIANRRTRARLVVLSACESALGRATVAEGVLGIASSFVSAGSRAVVGSLWEVDDRSTAELMQHFYHELARGKTTAAALQSARLFMRRRHPEPFFWAGFVVIGDGDVTVPLAARPSRASIGLALLVLILAVAWLSLIWRRRRRRVRIAA